ncbi:MAG: class I SAM-dependent methyltransferase [Verrucomicrobiaceae bacterium]|nr:class I SAM-dependent methyltransferase [Verrucomicrobiaceae bacterium]
MSLQIRPLLRKVFFTQNTLRYIVEWRCIESAWNQFLPRVETVFDGGAGSGEYLRRLLTSGRARKVIAQEMDDNNYHRLEQNLESLEGATLIKGSILDIPLTDAVADVVMSTQVLEHIEDHQAAATELNRVLKPGGYGIITTPHPPEPFSNPEHVREGYTEADLTALFRPLGWQPIHTDYFLTQPTVRAMLRAGNLPLRGMFMPVAMIDRERGTTAAQRFEQQPFGILMLFQKAL